MAFIDENSTKLRRRHYLRNATAPNKWFDFTSGKVNDYLERYGDDFCLIINGSHDSDDAYIIPFKIAREVFTHDALDARGRWVGTIEGSQLVLAAPSHNTLRISSYHNAFQPLNL
jgi:hypothetical protein